jgi:hypothetical protein
MEIVLTMVLVALTGYQFYHPSVESGAYTMAVYQDQIVRMNTRDGSFERCDQNLKCTPIQVDARSAPNN